MNDRFTRRGFTQTGTLALLAACVPARGLAEEPLILTSRFELSSYDENTKRAVVVLVLKQTQRESVELVGNSADLAIKQGKKGRWLTLRSVGRFQRMSRVGVRRRTILLPKGEEVRYSPFSGTVSQSGLYQVGVKLTVSAKDFPRAQEGLRALDAVDGSLRIA